MIFRIILLPNMFLISSCFDFNGSKFKDIGGGFKYGYYNGNYDLLDVYYNDGGIFHQMKSVKIGWNPNYIFVNCETLEDRQSSYFIIDKMKYQSNPIQLKSVGVLGPLNYDSLPQTDFYRKNHLNLKECSESWFH